MNIVLKKVIGHASFGHKSTILHVAIANAGDVNHILRNLRLIKKSFKELYTKYIGLNIN